jgi:hypothetical protein
MEVITHILRGEIVPDTRKNRVFKAIHARSLALRASGLNDEETVLAMLPPESRWAVWRGRCA